jgi:hypothetical protein
MDADRWLFDCAAIRYAPESVKLSADAPRRDAVPITCNGPTITDIFFIDWLGA